MTEPDAASGPDEADGEIDAHLTAGRDTVGRRTACAGPDELSASVATAGPPEARDLADLIGPFYDAAGLEAWLHLTPEALAAAIADHRILAITAADGTAVMPAWQFTTDRATIPHLAEVLQVLASGIDDPATWAMWLCAPDDDLQGLTSAEWLAAGNDPAPVLLEAARDAARWAT